MIDIQADRIKVGDRVRVYWEHIEWIEGEVGYVPCATGDSWMIKSADGTVHEVQTFGRMTKLQRYSP